MERETIYKRLATIVKNLSNTLQVELQAERSPFGSRTFVAILGEWRVVVFTVRNGEWRHNYVDTRSLSTETLHRLLGQLERRYLDEVVYNEDVEG